MIFWQEIKRGTKKKIAVEHPSARTQDKKHSSSEVLPKKLRKSS
jgi:hypothetical protein